jgi:uncharacterized protein
MQAKQFPVRPSRAPLRHCIVAVLAALPAASVMAQTTAAPTPSAPAVQPGAGPAAGASAFTVFLRGTDVGREQVNLVRSGSQWVLTSTGRIGDFTVNRLELKYTADLHPVELRFEGSNATKDGTKKILLTTSFAVTSAINEISQDGVTNSKTDQISARTTVLPGNSFAGYEIVAARLATLKPGGEIPIYIPPSGEVRATVKAISDEDVQTPGGIVKTRKFEMVMPNGPANTALTITIDERGRLARLDVPTSSLAVVRNDLAGVAVRPLTARNPTDSDVTIPANGFNIAGTLTRPPAVGRLRLPAVVLVAGSGPVDRDSTVAGIPILSQLAGALAEQGFLVLRYDKRGVGQSGGRTEAATQREFADDLIGIVKWLERRDDVDSRQIAVVGHSEGGNIAMLAAAREKKIDAVVLIAANGTTGAELILEQQRHELDRMNLSPADKEARIALQKQIQAAAVSGTGWEGVPPELQKQADTPWFKSFLSFDPAATMARLNQPLLILQGELDAQVRPHHADKLAELAQKRKKDAGPVEVVRLPGINHLLVPAKTGAVQDYGQLESKTITPEVASTIAAWLKKQQ